ncbi:F-box/LRR-repeat protein 2 isoform X2 [Diachasma alloeum]|uniref:F-box/LRR-repeat protein 2 isoform X2 n=1 Tax=Diachasma alloeum TaxID=454923 RepID=UPI000738257B|nr:F-box/LRR-repeat protein 2 isoform X2 [Diachasma alloeum]
MRGNEKWIKKRKISIFEVNNEPEPSESRSIFPESPQKRRKQEKIEKFIPEIPQQSAPASINDLNDDCLERIFKCLPLTSRLTVRIVSKRWEKASKLAWSNVRALNFSKSPLWNDLDELPPAFRSNTHIGAILKRCGGYLRELKIGDPCTYKILGLVGEYCVNLSRLEVSFDRYGQRFTTLFSKMNKLEYFGMKNLGKDVFQDFWGHSINNLREIHLCSQHCEENGTVRPRIYSSGLKQFTNLTAMTLEGFTLEPGVIRLISANPDLTCLSLANSRAKNFSPLTKLFSLEHLNLSKIINIGDDFITALTNNSRNLRYLNLNRCPGITTGGLSNLGNLPHLEELFLNSCRITDDVFKRLRSLKKLECEDCWSVDDPGITTLVNNSPNLRYLNLAGTNVTEKVLKTASSVTGRRNNFCLWVIVDKIVKTKWERSEDHGKCHLLIVDEANKIDNFDNDDRSLMEIYEESRLITNPELERLNQLRYNY